MEQTINRPDLFIFAGETSGDLHGEALLQQLYYLSPTLSIVGVPGPRMRKYPIGSLLPMEAFQVMGFVDVFFSLPKIARHFYFLLRTILQSNPKIVVFIDYPGFALRLEKKLRKKGFQGKIVHYICPSIWAWGKKRIPLMEKNQDLLLSIFPFEKQCFSPSFPIHYVGHPLVTRLKTHTYRTDPLYFPWADGKKIISIFPGSRKKEIIRNFPLELQTLKELLLEDNTLVGAISISQESFVPLLTKILEAEGLLGSIGTQIHFVKESDTYELMQRSFFALAKSGTVTLELALHAIPTVVVYTISPIDLFLAQKIFRICLPFYCIVNISAGKEVFAEFFGPNATKENLTQEAKRLLKDVSYREGKKALCQEVIFSFGKIHASQEAARQIISLL